MRSQRAEFREYEYKLQIPHDSAGFVLRDEEMQNNNSIDYHCLPANQIVVTGEGCIFIRAQPGSSTRILVEVCETEPAKSEPGLLFLSDCSLDVPSGRIVIAGSTNYYPDAARIPVQPALYKVRIYVGSLDTIHGGLRRSQDHYRVLLWLF